MGSYWTSQSLQINRRLFILALEGGSLLKLYMLKGHATMHPRIMIGASKSRFLIHMTRPIIPPTRTGSRHPIGIDDPCRSLCVPAAGRR